MKFEDQAKRWEEDKYFQALSTDQARPKDDEDVSVITREFSKLGDMDLLRTGYLRVLRPETASQLQVWFKSKQARARFITRPSPSLSIGLCPDRLVSWRGFRRRTGHAECRRGR